MIEMKELRIDCQMAKGKKSYYVIMINEKMCLVDPLPLLLVRSMYVSPLTKHAFRVCMYAKIQSRPTNSRFPIRSMFTGHGVVYLGHFNHTAAVVLLVSPIP